MNKVTHFEIVVIDPERAMRFYETVFEWKFEKQKDNPMEYWMIMIAPANTPGAINGGLRKEMGTDVKERTKSVNAFVCSIEVESIDVMLEKIQKNGGEIMAPKMEIPHLGYVASALDTEGNMFSMMQRQN